MRHTGVRRMLHSKGEISLFHGSAPHRRAPNVTVKKGKNPKSSCMMRQNNFIQSSAGNAPRGSSRKDAVGIVSQHQHAGNGPAPRRHDHQSCRRTRGTSIRNPRRSCRHSPPASVRARILQSARQRGLRVAVCRSGTWFPCQQGECCLKGGFRILGYSGSAIPDRAASHPQESISSNPLPITCDAFRAREAGRRRETPLNLTPYKETTPCMYGTQTPRQR